MRCKVAFLRSRGTRRPDDAVRNGPWLVGILSVQPITGVRSRGHEPAAVLMPETEALEPLATLFNAKLVRLNDGGMLLTGTEETWARKVQLDHRQSWWCIPMAAADTRSIHDEDDPLSSHLQAGSVSLFDAERVKLRVKKVEVVA